MTKILTVLLLAVGFSIATPAEGSVKAPNTKLYDFSFVDMSFDAVFNSVSKVAQIDIILAPEVKGKTSLNITKKTWQEALDIVCGMNDLTWVVEDKYIMIQKSSTYQAKQKKIADEEAQAEQNAPLVRKNFPIRHAKAEELVKVLESMKSNRGRITTVERTNSIIVYDTDGKIEQMEKALSELDVETLQIMITAKLVVVSSERSRELGVDWALRSGSMGLSPGTITDANGLAGGGAGATRTSVGAHSLPSRSLNAVGATADNPAPTAITASLLDNNLQIAIANIMSDAATEVLASPQVSTLDNTEAVVYMGDKISIRVIDDSGESSTQLVEAGIKLTVTPHVSGDNRILLDLHPQNDSYGYDTQGQVVISTQEAKTKVVVADGETVVIGGLTRNENTQSETGVPFLKDIPLLGNLFKYTRNQVEKRDLIIFVTPRIIRNYIGDVELSEPTMATPEVQELEPPATGKLPSDQKAAPAAAPVAKPAALPSTQTAKPAQPAKAPAAPQPVEEVEDWN